MIYTSSTGGEWIELSHKPDLPKDGISPEAIASAMPPDYPHGLGMWLNQFGVTRHGISIRGGYGEVPGKFVGFFPAEIHFPAGTAPSLWGDDATVSAKERIRSCTAAVCLSADGDYYLSARYSVPRCYQENAL